MKRNCLIDCLKITQLNMLINMFQKEKIVFKKKKEKKHSFRAKRRKETFLFLGCCWIRRWLGRSWSFTLIGSFVVRLNEKEDLHKKNFDEIFNERSLIFCLVFVFLLRLFSRNLFRPSRSDRLLSVPIRQELHRLFHLSERDSLNVSLGLWLNEKFYFAVSWFVSNFSTSSTSSFKNFGTTSFTIEHLNRPTNRSFHRHETRSESTYSAH